MPVHARRLGRGIAAGAIALAVAMAGAAPAQPAASNSLAVPGTVQDPVATSGEVTGPAAAPSTSAKAGEVLLTWDDTVNATNRGRLRARYQVALDRRLPLASVDVLKLAPGVSVETAVADLAKRPGVAAVQPNFTYSRQTDPEFTKLWGLRNSGQYVGANTQASGTSNIDVDAPEAWSKSTGSPALTVAVIDTGVQINHPDLAPNVWTNPNEVAGNGLDDDGNGYKDDVHGWDFVNNNGSVYDGENCGSFNNDDHGTHVAGTIAGADNGVGIVGVAPSVRIMPLKIIPCDDGDTADIIDALAYAKAKGARIANMSLGGPGKDTALKTAIDASGLLVVAAAGNGRFGYNPYLRLPSRCFNDGGDPVSECPMYPAAFSSANIISVAAVTNRGALAPFSSYGKTGPGGTTASGVDLAAPGQDILSSVPIGNGASSTYGVAYFSGTSMAAPHVSGIAALLLSTEPGLTVAQVKARILERGKALAALGSGRTSTGRLAHAAGTLGLTRIAASYSKAPVTYGYGSMAMGTLAAGAALPGRPLELLRYSAVQGGWVRQCLVLTSSDGVASCYVKPTAHTTYQWHFAGGSGLGGSWSGLADLLVAARVGVRVSDTTPKVGQKVTLTASVAPDHPGRTVYLERLIGSTWSKEATATLWSSSTRTFSTTPTSAGWTRWRVRFAGDADHLSGASGTVTLKAR